ncbi:P-loop NTPase [Fervidobacterium nodosum]|uniref:Cobyrinic acid ac-diamide synthase n=1 Tax=Fervidobacterium nodosum (strain ATCC 35602 / DSM 5306 / Rt17-B1) TaxID=381764 RepID=A7HK10_FERNB|nr:P-loop NTPase [Fervidobacterium nodosum]ABS60243.1 Cobyrinic acid ac-diamide synthase [Fervidobacterium nodosum Rt17-B1]
MQNQASSLKSGQIVAVISGKGGVGKTILATNLSAVFLEYGKKTLLLDADVGFTNADILLGSHPKYTLKDFVNHKCSIDDLVTPTKYGIDFVSLGGDVGDIITANEIVLRDFAINFLKLLDSYDIVIMDMPPGFSEFYMPFLSLVQDFVVLTTIEPTSVVNTYTIIKLLTVKGVTGENIHVVANMVQDVKDATKLLERFIEVTEKFINSKISSVTIVKDHPLVLKSVYDRELFVKKYRNIQPTFSVIRIASNILKLSQNTRQRENLFDKFIKLFRGA